MREVSVEVYELHELKQVDRDAYNQALHYTQERFSEHDLEINFREFLDSANVFARELGLSVSDYSFGLYEDGYVKLTEPADEDEIEDLVAEMKEMLLTKKGEAALTGVYVDDYIMNPFFELNPADLDSENFDVVGFLGDVLSQAVGNLIRDLEETVDSEEYMEDYADMVGLEFYKDGELAYL